MNNRSESFCQDMEAAKYYVKCEYVYMWRTQHTATVFACLYTALHLCVHCLDDKFSMVTRI